MKLMAAGDQVLVAEFGDRIDEAVNDQVHALAAKIEEQQIPGIGEVVPTLSLIHIWYGMITSCRRWYWILRVIRPSRC